MKLRVEATAEELATKSEVLFKALAKHIESHNPELFESIIKALPPESKPLKYRMLREQQEKADEVYQSLMEQMNQEIIDTLLGSVHYDITEHTKG